MEFHDIVRALRRQLIVVIAATVIGVCAGAVTALLTPQRFESSVRQLVSVDPGTAATSWELAQASSYAVQVSESYRSIITSTLVLQPVVDDLGLDVSPAELATNVRTSIGTQGALITTTVSDPNPGQAARIANAIAESFSSAITDELERREQATAFSIRMVTVQPAVVPTSAAAPNLALSIALGAALGIAAGVGLAVLRTVLDRRIRTLDDVDRAVRAPVIGGITYDPEVRKRPLLVATAPNDPRAEAYRSLRTNLRFLFPTDGTSAVFVVTSAGPSEGKSTTAGNLALALSDAGYRVAVLDADLRKPRLAKLFGIEGAVGLTEVLIGRVSAHEVMQRWGRNTLFLLPAGTTPPNPAEMLGSHAMQVLIDDLQAAFDVILIDAPPVLPVTDAAVVAQLATGVLLVAAAEVTTTDQLVAAADRIEAADAKVVGTVITMLPVRGPDKTAYGTYGYGAHSDRADAKA
ncbi:polysaccharide biosynthesis tyrosine autokinase [Microbacterium sp. nov. GSS16]|uniref:polysaccharide biosynthesis tyrosine autokinase n=1 Tax=Microbacterium sp. nov. GSS16 TaxID=3019890 RepID=UPI0023059443|nr:polysaccharide biosynthesis tyrosine autokinase [Microbacterium sp. nov. GSS16]WCD92901.1 polysaccharide biosynthesis tyrosine autokinase [Microbacterium sp. nov. GSS16]